MFFMSLLRFSLSEKAADDARVQGTRRSTIPSGNSSQLQHIPPALRQACVSGMVHAQDGVAVLNVCFEGLMVDLEDRKVLSFCECLGGLKTVNKLLRGAFLSAPATLHVCINATPSYFV
jgi:hypothetical protein